MQKLLIAAFVILSCSLTALAQGGPPAEGKTAAPPKGHEAFFKEIAKLMQRYPEAAKRFSIIDNSVKREFHSCPEGQVWGCREVCADWPHCHTCADWGCVTILK